MTARHTITRADEIYWGAVRKSGYSPDGRDGIKLDTIKFVDLGVPVTADPDGIVAGVTVFTDSAVTLTAADLTLATLDVPRNVSFVADTTAVTQTALVTGLDEYGQVMTELFTLDGTTTVVGAKAFSSLTQLDFALGGAGGVDVGFGDVLGLPFRLSDNAYAVGGLLVDNIVNTTAVFVTGLATTVTSTAGSGDVRGTVSSTGSLPNDSRRYTMLMVIPNISDASVAFGVDQA